MADFLYYWKRFEADTVRGPIYKLNQNSPVMTEIEVGDDLWAIGLHNGLYVLICRMTVAKTGVNKAGSSDYLDYGKFFVQSSPALTTFPATYHDIQGAIRSLSIKCDALALGQSFQGGAAVRRLNIEDRKKLVIFAAQF